MSEAPMVATPPQDRDIVVSQQDATEGPGWSIRGYQGPAALIAKTREQAVRLASVMAKDMAVDVWLLENGDYGLIARGRKSPLSRAARGR